MHARLPARREPGGELGHQVAQAMHGPGAAFAGALSLERGVGMERRHHLAPLGEIALMDHDLRVGQRQPGQPGKQEAAATQS